MKAKTLFSLFAVLLMSCIFTISASACSQGRGGMGGGPDGQGFRLLKFVDLSEKQKDEVSKIRSEHEDKIKAARENVRNARNKFQAQCDVNVSEEQIRDAFKPVAAAMENMAVVRVGMHQKIKTILSAEQVKKLEEVRALRHDLQKEQGRGFGHGPHRQHHK